MKIGILTYHRAINYGAFLQAYGLCQRLNEETDIEAEVIDFQMKKEYGSYFHYNYDHFPRIRHLLWSIKHHKTWCFKKKLISSFERGLKKMPLSDNYLISDSVDEFQDFVKGKYDFIIVGSDEVWKIDGFRGFPTPYWLPGNLECGKLSYAASSRNDFSKLDEKINNSVREYLEDFLYISVRDELTKANFYNYVGYKGSIDILPDPSFVYDYKPDGLRGRNLLSQRVGIDPCNKIMVVMIGHQNISVAAQIKKELEDDYQLVAVYSYQNSYCNLSDLDPFEWLDVIAGADFVCASYFHAICFSIICQVPFLAFNLDNKLNKVLPVLSQSGNNNRWIDIDEKLYEDGYLRARIEELSCPCNGQDYVKFNRQKFDEYISVIRQLIKNHKR